MYRICLTQYQLAKQKQTVTEIRVNTVEADCRATGCVLTGCVDVDVGFASTVFTCLSTVTGTALERTHTHRPR